jgi:uncharacterized Fe-S cluster-containing protein
MPDFTVSFDVYCGRCGAALCTNASADNRKKTLTINPCKKCLSDDFDDGYSKGYDEGSGKNEV